MRAAAIGLAAMVAACASVAPTGTREAVLAVDEQQRAMVASADVTGLTRLAHPNLRINAPTGRVLTKEQFLASLASGGIGAESFARTAEDVMAEVHLPDDNSPATPVHTRNVVFRSEG